MATIVQLRRGTASAWTSANTLLAEGEFALETDTKLIKIGDGITPWNTLGYNLQNINITGDVTGSGSTNVALTLANSGVTSGTYNTATTITPINVDAKGRITGTGIPVTITPAFSSITGKPSTLGGYGITDAVLSSSVSTTATASTIAERDSSGNLTANEFIGSGAGLTTSSIPLAALETTGTLSASTYLNGLGVYTAPIPIISNTQVVYGTGSGITASSNLIFDGTNLITGNGVSISQSGINITPVLNPTSGSISLITATGNLSVGTYYYGVAFQTALGVSGYYQIGPITTTSTQKQVTVTIPISSDSRVTSRVIYRTKVGGYYNTTYILATIADNTTTTYIDNIADTSLTVLGGALQINTTSHYLTINGNKVLTLDQQATYVGFQAGTATTIGSSQNVFVGFQAGFQSTSGSQNTYLGYEAGSDQTTGSNNTHIGAVSGGYISTGSSNSSLGVGALNGLGPNSSGNVGIGYYVMGDGPASATCNYNTAIGFTAGDIYAGNNAIFLGYSAGKYETTNNNVIVIDNLDRTTQVIQKSNALIYGATNTTPANQTLQLGGGGLVTIAGGLVLPAGAPSVTTNALYNIGGALYFNGLLASSGFNRIAVADANYTITATMSIILAYTSLTAARTLTLPSATNQGQLIWVIDESGLLSNTLSLTIIRAGTDTIEGQTSFVLTGQYAAICLENNGAGKWTVLTYEEIPILVSDANYTITYREDCIIQVGSLTAGRTITLPPASTTGQRVTIMDFSGAASASKIITVAPAGTDTLNGSTSPYLINAAYGQIVLVSNGSGKWSYSVALSNINLLTSFTEYAYNTSTTTTNDTTSFGNGSGGALVQAFAPTGENSIDKYFSFLQPVQPTDLIVLEVCSNSTTNAWIQVDLMALGFWQNTSTSTSYGMHLTMASTTLGAVSFNSAAQFNSWAALSSLGWRWRVRKTSQGNFAQGSPSFPFTLGDGTTKTFTITHNLGTPSFAVNVWETVSPYSQITASTVITNPTSTQVTLTFATAPVAGGVSGMVLSSGGTVAAGDRLAPLMNSELIINAAATASVGQYNRCYATLAAYALTLPPVLASAGKIVGVRIDSSSTYNVTVTGNLDGGATTYLMIPGECAEFKSDGTTWQCISCNTVDGTWTPTFNNFTVSGTMTTAGRFKKSGRLVSFCLTISASTSLTFSSGASFTLPIPQIMPSTIVIADISIPTAVGTGCMNNNLGYILAASSGTNHQFGISGTYFC